MNHKFTSVKYDYMISVANESNVYFFFDYTIASTQIVCHAPAAAEERLQ